MRGAAPQVLEAALLCSPWPLLDLNYGGKGVLWKSQMRIRPQGLAIGFNDGASHFCGFLVYLWFGAQRIGSALWSWNVGLFMGMRASSHEYQ